MTKKEYTEALEQAMLPVLDRITRVEAVISQIVGSVPVSVLAENEKIKIRRFMQGI